MEEKIVYFEKGGKENTSKVIELVTERARNRGIKKIVLASTRGDTARFFYEAFRGTDIKIVVVPWQHGFKEQNPFPEDLVLELRSKGLAVHFGTMLFHTNELYGFQTPKLLATLLRIFGQGIKVVIEIILMATDGGHLKEGEQIIAVAGTGFGADTAIVGIAAPSTKLQNLHISEIICKPL